MKYIGIIPARYGSTRFPGKPLAEISGKTMIRRVYEQACKCRALSEVVVATDHPLIYDHVKSFGRVIMTSTSHQSGTDRCREAIEGTNGNDYSAEDVVINIQGDEPLIHPRQIELLTDAFSGPDVSIASLMKKIESEGELFDENVVKVVVNANNNAIYFSRLPVPFYRGLAREQWLTKGTWYRHIGLYGFRVSALHAIGRLPASRLEQAESLEQLRWIEYGMKIHMIETNIQTLSVDTPDDLKKLPELPY